VINELALNFEQYRRHWRGLSGGYGGATGRRPRWGRHWPTKTLAGSRCPFSRAIPLCSKYGRNRAEEGGHEMKFSSFRSTLFIAAQVCTQMARLQIHTPSQLTL